jgi:RNA polymerase sigma-70 factor (ECF subfamily)
MMKNGFELWVFSYCLPKDSTAGAQSPMQNNYQFEGLIDEELVRLSQTGHKDAFSALTRRNYTVSLRLAISILGDREEA